MTQPLEKQQILLTKLSELEASIGKLYEDYAGFFPDYKEFWLSLANDEKQHASWVQKLQSLVILGSATFNEGRFNPIAIQTFLNYLKNESEKVTGQQRSIINALSITLYLEESLIENKYFEIIDGDSKEIKQILNSLASATQSHISKVREVFNNYKKAV